MRTKQVIQPSLEKVEAADQRLERGEPPTSEDIELFWAVCEALANLQDATHPETTGKRRPTSKNLLSILTSATGERNRAESLAAALKFSEQFKDLETTITESL